MLAKPLLVVRRLAVLVAVFAGGAGGAVCTHAGLPTVCNFSQSNLLRNSKDS